MNGLSGLKPTWGRVSRAGVFPLAESLDHIGPMARSALDAAIVLGVIAGADPDDPTAVPRAGARLCGDRSAPACAASGSACRPTWSAWTTIRGAPSTARSRRLQEAGATMVDVVLPASFDEATLRLGAAVRRRGALAHEATYPARAAEYGPVLAGADRRRPQAVGLELAQLQLRARGADG